MAGCKRQTIEINFEQPCRWLEVSTVQEDKMDMRLSIGNRFSAISFSQFQALVADFKELTENSFGAPCSLQISAMNQTKLTTTHWPDEHVISHMNEVNESATFFKTDDPLLVTSDIFDAAAYLDVVFRPAEWGTTPDFAFAHAEFKGNYPRRATFYIQPGDVSGFRSLKENHCSMVFGDGFDSHCDIG
jgi:hypothetical protein